MPWPLRQTFASGSKRTASRNHPSPSPQPVARGRTEPAGAANPPPAAPPPTRHNLEADMIELQQLTKRCGDKVAVDGISATIPPGVVTRFLGPNGPASR